MLKVPKPQLRMISPNHDINIKLKPFSQIMIMVNDNDDNNRVVKNRVYDKRRT